MEAEKGKRVNIRFKCRTQGGKVYQVGERDTLEFVIGAGSIPPALDMGVLGMKPGEHRTVRVPAAEANQFPFPRGSHFEVEAVTPPGIAYVFGPGNGGDVAELIPAGKAKHFREPLPPGEDLYFEIEMLAVESQAIN